MIAGPPSEILLARLQGWNFGFAQRKHAYRYRRLMRSNYYSARPKSDLVLPRDRRFGLAKQVGLLNPITRQALARRSSLRGLPKQSAAGTNQGIEAPNHFDSQTKLGNNGAIRLGRTRLGR
jgi:hypothetical protein